MVSVIMPCYNACKYIREAIESVVHQTYNDWELIIIDDGSTDDSVAVVEQFQKDNPLEKRVRLIRQENAGACRARNNGIAQANGEYIKFLDADDMLFPDALRLQVEQIANLKERQIPFGDYDNVDEAGNFVLEFVFAQQSQLKEDPVYFFFSEWRVLISCPLHRTALLREIGGFNESLMRGQEADLHLRMALADIEWIYIPSKQFKYREYIAQDRISCGSREKSMRMLKFREQRMLICEKLFLQKYGNIPAKYRTYFRDGWFDKARREFADVEISKGVASLNQSIQYSPMTRFQNGYMLVGKIIGFKQLEHLLRLRLRLLKKELE